MLFKLDLIFIKLTLFELGKEVVFSQFSQIPVKGIQVSRTQIFGIEKNIFLINNDKDIKFFS